MKSKMYYTIKNVSDTLGILPSRIRHWETKICKLHSKRAVNTTSSTDARRFSPSDILRIRVLKALVDNKKFTLEGAKKELIELDLL